MKVKLIVGLGNPAKQYQKTYHNIGFLAVDYLDKSPAGPKIQIPNSKLIKSEVFMNQSGNFVKQALKKYKIKPEELMVIHDDADIELGKYKICFGRGAAGHKGVRSIIDALTTKNFWRLRIGIRRGAGQTKHGPERKKASEMVLKKINKADWEFLEKVFQKISSEIKNLIN